MNDDHADAFVLLALTLISTVLWFGIVAVVQAAANWLTPVNLLVWGGAMSFPAIVIIWVLYMRGCNRPPL